MSITGAKAEVRYFNSQNLKYEVFISDVQFSSALGIYFLSVKTFHPKKLIKEIGDKHSRQGMTRLPAEA